MRLELGLNGLSASLHRLSTRVAESVLAIHRSRPKPVVFTRMGVGTRSVCGRPRRWFVRKEKTHTMPGCTVCIT